MRLAAMSPKLQRLVPKGFAFCSYKLIIIAIVNRRCSLICRPVRSRQHDKHVATSSVQSTTPTTSNELCGSDSVGRLWVRCTAWRRGTSPAVHVHRAALPDRLGPSQRVLDVGTHRPSAGRTGSRAAASALRAGRRLADRWVRDDAQAVRPVRHGTVSRRRRVRLCHRTTRRRGRCLAGGD